MADDVKVKFGGDFSDVSSNAKVAAKVAGNHLSESFASFGDGIISNITSALSIDNLVEKMKEGFKEAGEYFQNIYKTRNVTGVGGEELQRLSGLAKESGVSFEALAKSLGFFSMTLGKASKDAETKGKVFRDLGFSADNIKNGAITATQALAALAAQFEKTHNRALLAANSSEIFGRKSGKELVPIIMRGKSAIDEASKSTKVFTDATLDQAEASDRESERLTKWWKTLWRNIVAGDDKDVGVGVAFRAIDDAKKARAGKPTTSAEFAGEVLQQSEKLGLKMNGLLDILKTYEPSLSGRGEDDEQYNFYRALVGNLNEIKRQRNVEAENMPAPAEPFRLALTASSLQAIGGGDVNSVLAASYQSQMLDATNQVAENTRKLVEGPFAQPQAPAKAGR